MSIKVDNKEEYKPNHILQVAYQFNELCHQVKYKEYFTKERELLPAGNSVYVPDIVKEFLWLYPNQHLNLQTEVYSAITLCNSKSMLLLQEAL